MISPTLVFRLPLRAAALALAAFAFAPSAATADIRDAGRKAAEDFKGAIVTVRATISVKMTFGNDQSPEQEAKGETSGTVVSPDGTVIVPLSELDPSHMLKSRIGPERANELTIDSNIIDLKIVVDKRTEIPAQVVRRDPDLDLAVIRPVTPPATPMKSIDIKNSAAAKLLDEVFVMARMGRVADYEIGVMTGEIQSIVARPRKFYIPSAELASGGYGVPIFTADNKFVGLVLMRVAPGGSESSIGPGGDNGSSVGIILPAEDVQEIVDQAKEATPEAAPKAEDKPTSAAK